MSEVAVTISEQQRHEFFGSMREKLGSDDANTMMELLPPVDWSELATKADLRRLETRLDHLERRFDTMDLRFDAVHRAIIEQGNQMREQTSHYVRWLLASHAVVLAAVAAVVAAATGL